MERPIVKDPVFLGMKSEKATIMDAGVAKDLMDTLKANGDVCIGMAANMIGIRKNIIAVSLGPVEMVMFNPIITKKSKPYETEETCLSLTGERTTTRYEDIEVEYEDKDFKKVKKSFSGLTSEIIQHEVDHLNGVII